MISKHSSVMTPQSLFLVMGIYDVGFFDIEFKNIIIGLHIDLNIFECSYRCSYY